MNAISFRTGLWWQKPIAPQVGGTRTVIFECARVPQVFLANLPVAALGMTALLAATTEARSNKKAKQKQLRSCGRMLTDAQMLTFVCYRRDYRRVLVRHGECVQALACSGFEQTRQEFATLNQLRQGICALQAAMGLVNTSALLFAFVGRDVPAAMRSLFHFMVEAGSQISVFTKSTFPCVSKETCNRFVFMDSGPIS